ncbi:hypothetical protein EPYR_03214 [Erwinia pyrifoliae DSM 12163]|nr:hypothetical protein EPYR_03214 [Erwinia pyrifoliae DSM 12163]
MMKSGKMNTPGWRNWADKANWWFITVITSTPAFSARG